MYQGDLVSDRDGGNQAIDQLSDCLAISAAPAIQNRRLLVVHRVAVKSGSAGKQSSELDEVSFIAGTCKHFQTPLHRIASQATGTDQVYFLPSGIVDH